MNTRSLDENFIVNAYNRFEVEIASGSNSLIYDSDGREYIDMGSGIGVNLFGAADEEWRNAVIAQLEKIQHTSNLYYNEPCARLAEMLCKRSGMSRVFFSNSGAEANECAIKAARKFSADTKGDNYFTIITLWNSFHGRTITTLAATGQEHYHELYQPLTPGFVHAHAGNIDELEKLSQENKLAAIMIECIQGEGGVVALTHEYAEAIKKFVREKNILLIIDEVQAGNGRTGKLFSYEHYGFEPDIVTVAKGLGGGLPIGATLFNAKVQNVFNHGDHGSTFGGNPVICAGACNILSRIDDDLLNEVTRKGEILREILADFNPTGIGLMLGVKPSRPSREAAQECINNGVLCTTAKDKLRLLPPINIPESLLVKAGKVIAQACK
ncbi:MAG: aminotransferase class III-fold pyridoxal phosphate-dependent enzyme [Synergistaceae bacterium]|nr:aminotransferase class III-fold pyridoxal phosphate-dependent enzyme [Synergistaceae bacterium]